MDSNTKKKLVELESALKCKDIMKLKELCISTNGLLNSYYRKQI